MFTATDAGLPAQNDTLDVTISVGNVNRPPELDMIGDRTVTEGEPLEFSLTSSDPDSDELSYAIGNAPAGATLTDNSDGTAIFNWTPTFDQAGNYPDVLFTVTDNGVPAQSDSETITISIGEGNRPPELSSIGDRTVAEGDTLEFIITATDPDGDILSYPVPADLPSGATFTDNGDDTATFSWTPDFGQANNYQITFAVVDDGLPSENDTEVIMITVGEDNRLPTLDSIGDRNIDEGEELNIILTGSDPDGDALIYAIDGLPSGANFTDNGDGTAAFRWTPSMGQVGSYVVTFTVLDSEVPPAADFETITIVVNSLGGQPRLTCGGFNIVQTAIGIYEAPGFVGTVIVGTNRHNVLIGTDGPDLLLGLAGHDIILGKKGADIICGGPGNDILLGMDGEDVLYGENGHDLLLGGPR